MLHLERRRLAKATRITGNAVARLTLASSEPDASIFVYLSEVEAGGSVRYITEGMLRLLHRAEAESPPDYKTSWPFHPCTRAAAHLMPAGIAETISIAAIAVSWTLSAGSRLRISISGADAEHFPQVQHGRPPKLRIVTGEAGGSCFEIPVGVTD
jgi:predicted acyl esterase